jgi:hypothetical protein
MNAAVEFARPPSGQRQKKKINFHWSDHLALTEQQEILLLMNLVLEREDAFGYAGPISWDDGMSLMMALSDDIKQHKKRLLLVRENGSNSIIGFLTLSRNRLPMYQHSGKITQVFIHPEFRDSKFLESLVIQVIVESERLGFSVLNLTVRADTWICRLWQGLGFDLIARVDDFARIDGVSLDGCFMRQQLANLKKSYGVVK